MKTAAESGPVKDSGAHAVAELVRGLHFEILPLDGTEQQVLTHLGRVVNPSVTASPSKGLDATVELSERLVRAGYGVVPHLSARLVRDRVHLDELLDRLLAAGIRELFVPAGDAAAPAGQFEGALALLEALGSRRAEFTEIDITGYPESHHLISDEETTIRAVFAKAPTTTHIIIRSASTPRPSWIGSPRSEPGARTRPTGSACRAAWTT